MRIREVRTHVVRHPLAASERFGSAKGFIQVRQALLVEIVTDEGLSGWGEAHGPPARSRTVVEELYGPRLVGRDPCETAVLWHELYDPQRLGGGALSAVDIALWDLKGQALGQPIAALLGGAFRTEVRAYATGLFRREVADNAAALAREAAGYAAEGFRAMKMKVGFGVVEDVRNVRAVREAIGPDCLLAVDANEGYDAGTAVRLARRLAEYDVLWFEEPVPHDDLAGYRQVRAAAAVPVAGGETEYTRRGFYDLCTTGALDLLQPDLGGCGGFTEAQRIAGLAAMCGLPVYPHVFGTAVNLFASLQLLAALPPPTMAMLGIGPLLELDRMPNGPRDELARNPPVRDGDVVQVPQGPGLGLEIDRQALERWRA